MFTIPNYDQAASEVREGGFALAPVGEHVMTVASVKMAATKNNRPSLQIVFAVAEGHHAGRGITARFLMDSTFGPVMLIKTLNALGVKHAGGSFNEKSLIGRRCIVRVKEGEDKNGDPQPEFHYASALLTAPGGSGAQGAPQATTGMQAEGGPESEEIPF